MYELSEGIFVIGSQLRVMFRRFASTLPPTIRQLLTRFPNNHSLQVNGWIKSVRRQKRVAFAVITDGSTSGLQAVFSDPSLARPYVGNLFIFPIRLLRLCIQLDKWRQCSFDRNADRKSGSWPSP